MDTIFGSSNRNWFEIFSAFKSSAHAPTRKKRPDDSEWRSWRRITRHRGSQCDPPSTITFRIRTARESKRPHTNTTIHQCARECSVVTKRVVTTLWAPYLSTQRSNWHRTSAIISVLTYLSYPTCEIFVVVTTAYQKTPLRALRRLSCEGIKSS